MSAAEYLVGRVESGGAGAAILEAGTQRVQRAQGERIVMRAGDKLVTIRVAPAVIIGESLDGRWGELARHRLAALFQDVAPGDHVAVRLSGAAIGPGDRVAVRVRRDADALVAERVAYGVDDDALMRALAYAEADDLDKEAEAQREAQASAARAEQARTTTRPPWGRTTVVVGVAALGLAGIAALGNRPAWPPAVALGGATLMLWSARHDLHYVHRVGGPSETSRRQLVLFVMQLLAASIALLVAIGRNKNGPATPHPTAALVIACVIPSIAALVGLVRGFLAVRRLAPLEQAARLTVPPPPRTWGVIEGVVVATLNPVLSATTTRTVRSAGSGRGGWVWEELETTTLAAPGFELDAGAWRARVSTAGMIWAAPPAWQPLDDRRQLRAIAAVRPGDRVRVLARTGEAGDIELHAGGPESLFLVAGSASALLRRALRPPVMMAVYVAIAIASTFA